MKLATTCEFENDDGEIKTQIFQNCTSHNLRTKALERPELSLSQLLDIGKAMELSKLQAANIEAKQEALKVSKVIGNGGRNRHSYNQNQDGGRAIQNPKKRTVSWVNRKLATGNRKVNAGVVEKITRMERTIKVEKHRVQLLGKCVMLVENLITFK